MAQSHSDTGNSNAEAARGHSLLTIPPELAELIIDHATPSTLLALRRVSRETAGLVQNKFLEAYFSERAFLLGNEDSLRALLRITEHEGLARGLKTIDFVVEDVPDPEFDPDELREVSQPLSRKLRSKKDMKAAFHRREWQAAYDKQTQSHELNEDLHLLTIIFSRLRRLDHPIEIRIMDQYAAHEIPYGMKNLEWLIGEILMSSEDRERPYMILMEALALSAIPLRSFVIRSYECEWALTDMVGTPKQIADTRDVFRHLRKLHLMSVNEGSGDSKMIQTAFDLIASAELVEDLSLQTQWRSETYNDILEPLCHCLKSKFPRLRTLDLQGYDLPFGRLMDILAHHPQLDKLHFHSGEEVHDAYPDGRHSIAPHHMVDGWALVSTLDLKSVPKAANFKFKMIAPCTVMELIRGKDYWEEMLHEAKFGWDKCNICVIADL